MSNEFFTEFNLALSEMEAEFSEPFTTENGSVWPAIAIDKLEVGTKVMLGGILIDATTAIFVRASIFTQSGVKSGSILIIRDNVRLSVVMIDSDGDDSRTLVCGPAQVDVWR